MNDNEEGRQYAVARQLAKAVSHYGEIHLQHMDESIIDQVEELIESRLGRFVTVVKSAAGQGVSVTILFEQDVNDKLVSVPVFTAEYDDLDLPLQ